MNLKTYETQVPTSSDKIELRRFQYSVLLLVLCLIRKLLPFLPKNEALAFSFMGFRAPDSFENHKSVSDYYKVFSVFFTI